MRVLEILVSEITEDIPQSLLLDPLNASIVQRVQDMTQNVFDCVGQCAI